MFLNSFPDISGRYPVGATTFTHPVCPAFNVGSAKRKSINLTSEPALRLEEIAFTAYYPSRTCDLDAGKSSGKFRKGLDWLAWLAYFLLLIFTAH